MNTRYLFLASVLLLAQVGCTATHGDCGSNTTDPTYVNPPSCHGSPTPCSLRSQFDCGDESSLSGCSLECEGISTSCYNLYSSISCVEQEGCYWSQNYCGGIPSSCTGMFGEIACESQDGCSWSRCTGAATSCESLISVYECYDQPGCGWY